MGLTLFSRKHTHFRHFLGFLVTIVSGAMFYYHLNKINNYRHMKKSFATQKTAIVSYTKSGAGKPAEDVDPGLTQLINETLWKMNNFQVLQSNQIFVPQVYRKDRTTLQEYLKYLGKLEKPFALLKKAVIILTNYRSGSSFFGELFNQHPDVFYTFEPLYLTSDWSKCPLDAHAKKQFDIMENLAQCIIPNWKKIYKELPNVTNFNAHTLFSCTVRKFCFAPFTKELDSENHCPRSHTLKMEHNPWLHCGSINVNLVANECRRKKISAMKVIRVCDINQFEEIVTKHGVDLKVLHLLRDPRGIASSRLLLHKRISLTNSLNFTCSRQLANVKVGLFKQPQWLKGNYKVIRYEDLALDPIKTAQNLYDFLHLDFPKVVKDWIYNNTQIRSSFEQTANGQPNVIRANKTVDVKKSLSARDPWSRKRDSKTIVNQWQHHLTFSQVKKVEKQCHDVMTLLGYIPVKDQKEYTAKSNVYLADFEH